MSHGPISGPSTPGTSVSRRIKFRSGRVQAVPSITAHKGLYKDAYCYNTALPTPAKLEKIKSTNTMKAIVFKKFGPSSVLEFVDDWPVPEPKQGEVLIKQKATGVNPIDPALRTGGGLMGLFTKLPKVRRWVNYGAEPGRRPRVRGAPNPAHLMSHRRSRAATCAVRLRNSDPTQSQSLRWATPCLGCRMGGAP